MTGRSKIEWTDDTWNPMTGCTPISPGCERCYAKRTAENRLAGRFGYSAAEPFRPTLRPDRLEQPLHWREPRTVFVVSMGDLFHPDVPFEFIALVWGMMMMTPWHTHMVLTKRPKRMGEFLRWLTIGDKDDPPHYPPMLLTRMIARSSVTIPDRGRGARAWYRGNCDQTALALSEAPVPWPLPHVQLGVTVENADYLWRIRALQNCPAAVRFVSLEPLLGPVVLEGIAIWSGTCGCLEADAAIDGRVCRQCHGTGAIASIDGVIVGGENGPGARPMNPTWVRDLRDECVQAGVPFFFKGWGAWLPTGQAVPHTVPSRRHGWERHPWPQGGWSRRVGRRASGRLLDGVEWNQPPTARD